MCGQGCPRVGRESDFVQLGLGQPLVFRSPVLEPDLDLGLAQLQLVGKLRSLGNRQVLFLLELILERHQLLGGERGPGLPVSFVLPQVALERQPWHVGQAFEAMGHGRTSWLRRVDQGGWR